MNKVAKTISVVKLLKINPIMVSINQINEWGCLCKDNTFGQTHKSAPTSTCALY